MAGLAPTLAALVERRVDTLLVSDGFEAPGWRCPACDWIGAKGRACPVCDTPMDLVDDVVEEAIEAALGQSCRVEVCREGLGGSSRTPRASLAERYLEDH